MAWIREPDWREVYDERISISDYLVYEEKPSLLFEGRTKKVVGFLCPRCSRQSKKDPSFLGAQFGIAEHCPCGLSFMTSGNTLIMFNKDENMSLKSITLEAEEENIKKYKRKLII